MNIELLSPAGGIESLNAAARFGADAVYAAGKSYGMRAFADNFSPEELKEAAKLLHSKGKKLYIAINSVFRDSDFEGLEQYIGSLRDAGADAFIITDPGVLSIAKQTAPEVPIHLSTQANTTNAKSALFWHEMGVKRVILARELSLEEITRIRRETPDTLELEAFVHGAMCISYSGRCLLSDFFTARGGNRGECAQPCRWEYHISERGYEGEYFPVQQDDRGTYILNSKDLNMIAHIKELADAGVTSLKIEGRMKSAYYVACVTKAYRRALNDMLAGRPFNESLMGELDKAGTREYTTGFFFGNPREGRQYTHSATVKRDYDFVAIVKAEKDARGLMLIEQRGKFLIGDELEILSPEIDGTFTIADIITPEGEKRESAPHPKEKLFINCPFDLKPGDMLRKKRV